MNLITVYSAFSPAEAQLVRSLLDASGLHPFVAHEIAASTMDGYSMAAGGILVQVPEVEANDARELITNPPPADPA